MMSTKYIAPMALAIALTGCTSTPAPITPEDASTHTDVGRDAWVHDASIDDAGMDALGCSPGETRCGGELRAHGHRPGALRGLRGGAASVREHVSPRITPSASTSAPGCASESRTACATSGRCNQLGGPVGAQSDTNRPRRA